MELPGINSHSIDDKFHYVNQFGWGIDVLFKTRDYLDGTGNDFPTWFHIPITTLLSIDTFERTYLLSVRVLFSANNVEIKQIDVYDGATFIHRDVDERTGNMLHSKDDRIENIETLEWQRQNNAPGNLLDSINLDKPHLVYGGIGISIFAHIKHNIPIPDNEFEARLNWRRVIMTNTSSRSNKP